jgi:hypothetical protein
LLIFTGQQHTSAKFRENCAEKCTETQFAGKFAGSVTGFPLSVRLKFPSVRLITETNQRSSPVSSQTLILHIFSPESSGKPS